MCPRTSQECATNHPKGTKSLICALLFMFADERTRELDDLCGLTQL